MALLNFIPQVSSDEKPSRRDVFKLGLLSSGTGLLARRAARADSTRAQSPTTRPFVEELPISPIAQPVQQLSPAPAADPVPGEAPRGRHQFWEQFPPKKLYLIEQMEGKHSFHPDLPVNTIWGYNGITPGPTFHARYGEPVVIRYMNMLPANHVGFGIPQVTVHLHNGHTGSESDGFPADFFDSGLFKDNHYPNVRAGFTDPRYAPLGDLRETLGTLWYHDHRFDFTSQNGYRGLAGFYLLFDEQDSCDETDSNPRALRLPSGEFDVPLVFQDRAFDSDGQLYYDVFNFDGIIGDKFLVNGKIQPFLRVARRKYRFRFLDAGPSRFYEFVLSSGQKLIQISNDGNLLPAPLPVESVRLGVAERTDVIVDFSNYRVGDRVYLVNRLEQVDGRGPTANLLNPGVPILEFRVDRDAPDPSQVPAKLRELPPIDFNEVRQTRTWVFNRDNGAWAINGQFFSAGEVRADPQRGTAEIWVLKNGGGGWSHPIHIHLEEFRILSRNGAPPPSHEQGRKDVVVLHPDEEVQIFMRFRDFVGRYPMHCHNMVHEDHAMMLRWDVVPAQPA